MTIMIMMIEYMQCSNVMYGSKVMY